jgi:hypothetical protein
VAKVKTSISKVKKRTDYVELKQLGIQAFDSDNCYPQRTIDIRNDSGTAKSCHAERSKYTAGRSFSDENLGSIVLNRKGLTADMLRKKIADSITHHRGGVFHFNYNGLGEKTEINFVPFEFGRLTLDDSPYPDRVAIYNNWDGKNGKFEKKDIKYIHKYDKFKVFEQVEAEEVKIKGDDTKVSAAKFDQYQGQIYYWTPDGSDKYPLCAFDAVLEDCITEAQTKRFKASTSSRNFMPSHILVTGREETELDENGKPIEGQGGGLSDAIGQFQGSEESGQIFHVEKDNPDEPFEFHKVDIQNFDGLQKFTEESATEDIVRAFNVPDILVLRRAGGLGGNGSELYEARTYLNENTQPDRDTISQIIAECFDNFVGNTGFTDFSILPLQLEKPVESSDVISLMSIIKDPELNREQKAEILSLVHRLSESRINKLLGNLV